jgi:hypothetical protein
MSCTGRSGQPRGLLDYIWCVQVAEPTPGWTLGTERLRFDHVVGVDRDFARGGGRRSRGYFDYSALDDTLGVDMYREILNRAWPEDGSLPTVPIEDYRLLMEHLDGVAPSAAATIGRWMLQKRGELRDHGRWASGTYLSGDRLIVHVCDDANNYEYAEHFAASVAALQTARAIEVREQGIDARSAAIGVLDGDGYLDYVFIFSDYPAPMPSGVRFAVEREHGVIDVRTRQVRKLELRRNERCPCGSGQKVKQCHPEVC